MMKHIFILVAVSLFLIVTAVVAQTPNTGWYTGNAGAASFTISNADELEGLAQIVNGTWGGEPVRDDFLGKTVILDNNIDLSAYDNWIPIGNNTLTDSNKIFSGTFDGGGYTISKLTINRPDTDCQGLFGVILRGKVENLRLDDVNITGSYYAGSVAGIICSSSSVNNCYSTGMISGNSDVGGVVGVVLTDGSVKNSSSSCTVSAFYGVGGVAGNVYDGSHVANCYSTGSVSGAGGPGIGGVAGTVGKYSSVTNSYSTGTVSGTYITSSVGGVAGKVENNSSVTNCYSTGAVSGDNWTVGGVAGTVYNSSIANCYSAGAVNVNDWMVGGVVGVVMENSDVSSCAALNQEVRGDSIVGRVAGFITNMYSVSTLSNNVAYIGMTHGDGMAFTLDDTTKVLGGKDGADITIAEILADGTIGGRFTAENDWSVAAGSLPGLLGNTVPMPVHLGGASVKFLRPSLHSGSSARFISASGRTLHLRLSERGNVSVYALNGAKLRTFDLAGGSHSLTVNDLPRGMYVVRAVSGSWKQSVRFMVK